MKKNKIFIFLFFSLGLINEIRSWPSCLNVENTIIAATVGWATFWGYKIYSVTKSKATRLVLYKAEYNNNINTFKNDSMLKRMRTSTGTICREDILEASDADDYAKLKYTNDLAFPISAGVIPTVFMGCCIGLNKLMPGIFTNPIR